MDDDEGAVVGAGTSRGHRHRAQEWGHLRFRQPGWDGAGLSKRDASCLGEKDFGVIRNTDIMDNEGIEMTKRGAMSFVRNFLLHRQSLV